MAVWVFSPVRAINDALLTYVAGLGFDVQVEPARADAALFDLSSYSMPLPGAPVVPTIALLRSADRAGVLEAYRAGYRLVHRPGDGEAQLRMGLSALLTGRLPSAMDGTDLDQADPTVPPRLTPREAQVLSLLMLGMPNKRIASRLGLTERTVKFHVSALMRKYGATGRVGLVVKRQRAGRASS